ncbi:hypothetical protein JD844_004682 [Phrynosoma platyrhinos]|uniref:Uncharacterized protein n=1 Tax=Phrynosoma platyrhinos TaxID=52577 RepID=A0ABQ7SDP0_PHRPL|nr:hypothetical protein JD844_004682 [Phrynosoma platyrhinos]
MHGFLSCASLQAEIRHLQNICRAAHQERKLLLKQQKDLLLVQQTTAQLWKQLHEQLEKSLQQAHGTQKESTKAPLHVSSVATGFESSRARNRSSPLQGVDTSNLRTESGGMLSQGVAESEEFPKEKQQPRAQEAEDKDAIISKDIDFSREQPISSAIRNRGCKETREAEDAQDTDISLPEEFIFQEQLHDDDNQGFHDTLAIPRIAIDASLSSGKRGQTQMSGDHSDLDDLSATCSQGKTLEGIPASERADGSDSMILSSDGSPRPTSPWKGGSHSDQANAMTLGRDTISLKNSGPRAECEDKTAFQGDAEPEAILSCSRTSFDSLKDQKKQGPIEVSSTIEGDCNDENPSRSKAKDESMMLVPKSSSKDVDSTNDDSELLASGEVQLFPFASQNSSNSLLVLDSRSGCVEHSVGEGQSRILNEVPTTQLPKVSMSNDEIDVGPLCSQSTEGTANGNQNGSSMNSQKTKASGMLTVHSSSPKAGEFSPENQNDTALPSNGHLPGIEDEIPSPVDEVLSYESSDLPSSTEKDISFQNEDLPDPPEDLSEKGGDSNFSLQDFPSPPEPFVFPETGELQYATEEDTSIKTNDLPSLSDDLRSEEISHHYL